MLPPKLAEGSVAADAGGLVAAPTLIDVQVVQAIDGLADMLDSEERCDHTHHRDRRGDLIGVVAGQMMVGPLDPQTTVLFMVCGIVYGFAVMPTLMSTAASPQPLKSIKLDLPKEKPRALATGRPPVAVELV